MANAYGMEESKRLIYFYEKHPVLWKVDHVDYGKRGPKYDALKRIKAAMPGRGEFNIIIGKTVVYDSTEDRT